MRIENSGIPYTYILLLLLVKHLTNRHGTPCTNAISYIYIVHLFSCKKTVKRFSSIAIQSSRTITASWWGPW